MVSERQLTNDARKLSVAVTTSQPLPPVSSDAAVPPSSGGDTNRPISQVARYNVSIITHLDLSSCFFILDLLIFLNRPVG